MKKKWAQPMLETLDITLTMAGAGIKMPDDFNDDPDEHEADHYS